MCKNKLEEVTEFELVVGRSYEEHSAAEKYRGRIIQAIEKYSEYTPFQSREKSAVTLNRMWELVDHAVSIDESLAMLRLRKNLWAERVICGLETLEREMLPGRTDEDDRVPELAVPFQVRESLERTPLYYMGFSNANHFVKNFCVHALVLTEVRWQDYDESGLEDQKETYDEHKLNKFIEKNNPPIEDDDHGPTHEDYQDFGGGYESAYSWRYVTYDLHKDALLDMSEWNFNDGEIPGYPNYQAGKPVLSETDWPKDPVNGIGFTAEERRLIISALQRAARSTDPHVPTSKKELALMRTLIDDFRGPEWD